jgi:error-prone DNA polymerase
VEEAVHRAALNRQALARLAEADSFARLSTKRSKAHWAALGADVTAMRDLLLFTARRPAAGGAGTDAALGARRAAVVSDYRSTGLTLRQHPLALLRPTLDRLRLDNTRRFRTARQGQTIRLPGMVLLRQQPGMSEGRSSSLSRTGSATPTSWSTPVSGRGIGRRCF